MKKKSAAHPGRKGERSDAGRALSRAVSEPSKIADGVVTGVLAIFTGARSSSSSGKKRSK